MKKENWQGLGSQPFYLLEHLQKIEQRMITTRHVMIAHHGEMIAHHGEMIATYMRTFRAGAMSLTVMRVAKVKKLKGI